MSKIIEFPSIAGVETTVVDQGRLAAKAAKSLGVQVGTVPDERWGSVNSYPVELLDEVVYDFLGEAA